MDLDSIKNQVANLTLYDIKAGVRKVQNAVMNYTEIEAKVREATNNDPWGSPSSLMQEIANATHSYQQLNEIMPLIYKRFTDKTAEEWRQIYKSLQLLEFLVKNGSERVIDDARSHLSLLRMLKQFHFIDQNGKDQGVNVRNRAQELSKLLSDVDAIRAERKKARANKNKYGGVEGGGGLGSGMSSSNRYGGFGSDEPAGYGGYQGEVYGDGGGFGGRESQFSDTQRRTDKFEEYDEGDEVSQPSRTMRTTRTTGSSTSTASRTMPKAKAKEPEPDLLGFDDEPVSSTLNGKAPVTSSNALGDFGTTPAAAPDEDDFDDFQSATSPGTTQPQPSVLSSFSPPPHTTSTTTSSTQFAAPKPVAAHQAANYTNILTTTSPAPPAATTVTPKPSTLSSAPLQAQAAPMPYKPSGPNYFTSVPLASGPSALPSASTGSAFASQPMQPSSATTTAANLGKPPPRATAPGAGADAFSSLWSTASSKAGLQNKSANAQKGPDLASMAKAKSEAGIWGMVAAPGQMQGGSRGGAQAPTTNTASQGGGSALDDLLG